MSKDIQQSQSSGTDLFDAVRWNQLTLSDYKQLYSQQIVPLLKADGFDPSTDKPTHDWLQNNDCRPFVTALSRHHSYTFDEFWTNELSFTEPQDQGYPWNTDHKETIEVIESFVQSRRDRHGLSDSSIDAIKTRLNLYCKAYVEANETGDLVDPIRRDSDHPPHEAVDYCYAAFDWLHSNDSYQAATLKRTRRVVDAWYSHLVSRRIAALNPATGLYDEFKWEVESSSTPALSSEHISSLIDAAESIEEELLVIVLAGWGLRANEVASLHISQFHWPCEIDALGQTKGIPLKYEGGCDRVLILDLGDDTFSTDNMAIVPLSMVESLSDIDSDEPPFIQFDSRKNGPGEVSVLFGVETLCDQVSTLVSPSWNGYLFPSNQGKTGHITRTTVRNRFLRLCDRAGIPDSIAGQRPNPQLCRRFWYDAYSSVLEAVLDGVEEIASEQGSSDPEVVMQNYLSDTRSRQLRREFMREKLQAAFSTHKPHTH